MRSVSSFSSLFLLSNSIILLALFVIIPSSEGTGQLTWGQACNPSASLFDDQSTLCDTSKRLSCDMRTGACKCHHDQRDFYNGAADRCETKIGKFCSSSETFPTICVENAMCDSATNFCICEEGAEANEDGTACLKPNDGGENSATSLKCFHYLHFIIVILVPVLFGRLSL